MSSASPFLTNSRNEIAGITGAAIRGAGIRGDGRRLSAYTYVISIPFRLFLSFFLPSRSLWHGQPRKTRGREKVDEELHP